jgi:16S rRNA (guanine527-N7)-methyltransferase
MQESFSLKEAVRKLLGRELSSRQLDAFAWYSSELREWNQRFNLTAIKDPAGIEIRHFLDSLTCYLAMSANAGDAVVDVGTGAGFPGIPLKILCPNMILTLVEATNKKVEFCNHVVTGLSLENVQVVHGRAEDTARDRRYREAYDIALARAVAPLPVLVEYLLPFLRIGGRAIAQKGETAHAEAHDAQAALVILGGSVDRLIPVELPGVVETRYLVVLKKLVATPEKYPRRAGIPEKRPLQG